VRWEFGTRRFTIWIGGVGLLVYWKDSRIAYE
jgi:hypothetical protein